MSDWLGVVASAGVAVSVATLMTSLVTYFRSRRLSVEAEQAAYRDEMLKPILSAANQATIRSNADAVGQLVKSLEGLRSGVIVVGDLLLVKSGDAVTIRRLSPAEQEVLKVSPEVFRSPEDALRLIESAKGDDVPDSVGQ
jgi:hypothetical protein